MVEPVDVILAFHNAFRQDMAGIDSAALESARGKQGMDPALERFRFLNEVLVWHADGEEKGVFPAIETVAPLVAEAYVKDHRGLDSAFMTLDKSVSARDKLEIARATAAFRFHLKMHLAKEDTHLYRIFRERIPLSEQRNAMNIMAAAVPRKRFPELVEWMFPLIRNDDRENVTRIWQVVMPPAVFDRIKGLIKKAIGGKDWGELTRRIPSLEE
jgi:hypothetical protein